MSNETSNGWDEVAVGTHTGHDVEKIINSLPHVPPLGGIDNRNELFYRESVFKPSSESHPEQREISCCIHLL